MRNIFKSVILATIAGLFISSCSDDAVSGLSGKYPAPEEYKFTSLISQQTEKEESKRIYTVEIATGGVTGANGIYSGNGEVLKMQFVGDTYYLPGASYTAAPEASAKKGNYILGYGTNSGSVFYKVADKSSTIATPHLITKGVLMVTKESDEYTFFGSLWLDNGETIKVVFTGVIEYEPEPLELSKVLSVSSAPAGGANKITLKLGTDGVVIKMGEYGPYYGGNGNYLSVDFLSDDPTLAAGTYTPADNETATAGNYVKGYDTIVDWGWGPMEMFNWGTCWFTVEADEESGVHIENNNIVVEKTGTVYTITVNEGDAFAQYVGEIAFPL